MKTLINKHIDVCVHPCGLIITKYHPIKINSQWIFPINSNLFEVKSMYLNSLYSIGVEDSKNLSIDGFEVIGLGHGITNDSVASQDYFGTNKVIKDIFALSSNGYCTIYPCQIIVNSTTNLISGIFN